LSGPFTPLAARVGDQTDHGGRITGPGVASVLIEGRAAAAAGDGHTCPIPPVGSHPAAPFPPASAGSRTVSIGGRPALRTGDAAVCGARVAVAALTVAIGG
jgi:uncharacterized Zn-binding protein involved in type VI secretion